MSEMLATLRHVSASGRIDQWWQFCDVAGRPFVLASIVLGAAQPVEVEIDVCSMERERTGAWFVTERHENIWVVHPAMVHLPQLMAKPHPFLPRWPIGSLLLLGAPANVSEDLRRL